MPLKTEEVRVRPPVKQGKLGSGPFKQRKLGLGPPLKLMVRVRTPLKQGRLGLGADLKWKC